MSYIEPPCDQCDCSPCEAPETCAQYLNFIAALETCQNPGREDALDAAFALLLS